MQGAVREIALDIVRADGRRLPVLVNSVLQPTPAGEPQLVRTTVFDATDRKRYERELLAARDRERAGARADRAAAADHGRPRRGADRRGDRGAVAGELTRVPRRRARGRRRAAEGGGELRGSAGRRGAAPDAPAGPAGRRRRGRRTRRSCCGRRRTAGRARGRRSRGRASSRRTSARSCDRVRRAGGAGARARAALRASSATSPHAAARACSPATLPADPRFEVAAAYRPAVEHLEVGGDWYDAFRCRAAASAIVRRRRRRARPAAASAMGQLRSAVRALAGAGLGPGGRPRPPRHVRRAGRRARQYATLAYAEVDPATGARALRGRRAPAAACWSPGRRARAVRWRPLDAARRHAARRAARARRRSRSRRARGFLLYTDGLVERRSESIDDGLARLLDAVARARGRLGQELVDAVPDAVAERGAVHDDICLLSFSRR